MKPIDPEYMLATLSLEPGNRLHRLVARLFDTYIDDLTEELIEELERVLDERRICHASGRRFE